MFDYLIVGAGFAGSVLAERLATQENKKILIIDKREHIGGNAYDYYNNEGIAVNSSALFGEPYGKGYYAFDVLLREWRDAGDLKGLILAK